MRVCQPDRSLTFVERSPIQYMFECVFPHDAAVRKIPQLRPRDALVISDECLANSFEFDGGHSTGRGSERGIECHTDDAGGRERALLPLIQLRDAGLEYLGQVRGDFHVQLRDRYAKLESIGAWSAK